MYPVSLPRRGPRPGGGADDGGAIARARRGGVRSLPRPSAFPAFVRLYWPASQASSASSKATRVPDPRPRFGAGIAGSRGPRVVVLAIPLPLGAKMTTIRPLAAPDRRSGRLRLRIYRNPGDRGPGAASGGVRPLVAPVLMMTTAPDWRPSSTWPSPARTIGRSTHSPPRHRFEHHASPGGRSQAARSMLTAQRSSLIAHRSYTTLPPTIVASTLVSRISSSGIVKRSRSRMTRSASLPGASAPLTFSMCSAYALPTV